MKTKTPILVLIIGFIIFIGTLVLISATLNGTTEIFPEPWYGNFILAISFFYLVSVVWMWKMQKRGLELYILLAILVDIVGFTTGYGTLSAYFIPIIFILLLSTQYSKMTAPSLVNLTTKVKGV